MAASCSGRGVGGEAAPVGVGFLGDDLALLDQPLQHAVDVEAIAPALEAQGQVLEVDEDGQRTFAVIHGDYLGRISVNAGWNHSVAAPLSHPRIPPGNRDRFLCQSLHAHHTAVGAAQETRVFAAVQFDPINIEFHFLVLDRYRVGCLALKGVSLFLQPLHRIDPKAGDLLFAALGRIVTAQQHARRRSSRGRPSRPGSPAGP